MGRGRRQVVQQPIRGSEIGGEAGIRTLGTAFRPYNGLANRRLQPLGHLTGRVQVYARKTLTRKRATATRWRRPPFKRSPSAKNTAWGRRSETRPPEGGSFYV